MARPNEHLCDDLLVTDASVLGGELWRAEIFQKWKQCNVLVQFDKSQES